VISVAAHSIIF